MSATRCTFAVTVTIDEADTAKTADRIRRLLESNGYRQATCDYDVYAVYTSPAAYYSDWRILVADLGTSALPLTHVTVDDFRKLVRK